MTRHDHWRIANRKTDVAVTETEASTDATETGRRSNQPQRKIPAVSPVVDHSAARRALRPCPTVAHHVPHRQAGARAGANGGSGVKLAKISRAGDRVFRGLAGGSGLSSFLLVVFVGVFLLGLALPSLRAEPGQLPHLAQLDRSSATSCASGSPGCCGPRCCPP